MRRLREGLAALCATATIALVGAAGAGAAEPTAPITDSLTCQPYGDVEICSGQVPSFDGSPLDVDVTKPAHSGGGHPIIAMMHGFGNDKREWEFNEDEGDGADKWHWNNHWFAKHGFYVINYTARGFRTNSAPGENRPATPAFTSEEPTPPERGVLRLKSREYEVRDTQWLAALVARDFDGADARRVAVTGGSYGGGESWLQASRSQFAFPNSQDPTLPVLDLQVAVPKYPWTDLAYSLGPNGHPGGPDGNDPYESSYGKPESDTGDGTPFGIVKLSFVSGLFAVGQANGTFQRITSSSMPPPGEGPIDITAWNARALLGEPYTEADPIGRQIRRGLTEFRSPYYQQDGWESQRDGRKVAIFAIQGWTDDLFPAVEGFRMFKYLKRLDPRWPVELELADIGHSRGRNEPATWRRLNAQAFQFLQSNIQGSKEQETRVSSEPTICEERGNPDQREAPAQRLAARTPEGLAAGELTVSYSRPGNTSSTAAKGDPNGPATDPTFGAGPLFGQEAGACRTSPGPAAGGHTALSAPLPKTRTYLGLGTAEVTYEMTGTTSGTLNARLWDDPPGDDAKPLLMSRGAYRIDTLAGDPAIGALRLPLFGNHWQLAPGHRVRLDLTPVDQPFLRPANGEYTISFAPPTLRLPTRESGTLAIAGD